MQECLSIFKDKTTEISSATPVWNSKALNLATVNKDFQTLETRGERTYRTTPPLPFQGNKRNHIKILLRFLQLKGFDENFTYFDVFGGSGLISHNIKFRYPKAEVIYNDFDYYTRRIAVLPYTNEILNRIYDEVLKDNYKENERINETDKVEILKILSNYQNDKIDFLTLSSALNYGGFYKGSIENFLKSSFFYRKVKIQREANGYLKDVKIIHKDFKEVLKMADAHKGKKLLILDPPYLLTDLSAYSKTDWRLTDFLYLINNIKPPFVFFSNEKSQIRELFEYYKIKIEIINSSVTNKTRGEISKDYFFYKG